MTPVDDYRDNVANTEFVDQDVERLILGLPPRDTGLAALTPLVEALRSEGAVVPSIATDELAAQAAATVRATTSGDVGVVPSSSIERPDRRPAWMSVRAAAALLAAGFAVVTLVVGFAANIAVPGDPLYSIDRALEAVGIGNGTVDERLHEADVLIEAGDAEGALLLLSETYDKAASMGDADGVDKTRRHLSTGYVSATSELREFLAQNAGEGIGLDGDEFERALRDLIRTP